MKIRTRQFYICTVGLLLAGALLLFPSGCGGGKISTIFSEDKIGELDRTPPSDVSSLSVESGDGDVVLTWTNPTDADFTGVLIRRGVSGYPNRPTASDSENDKAVYNGSASTFTDTGLTAGNVYYYSAFAHDATPNYSSGATIATTSFYVPFTLIALPDTQYYSLDYPTIFTKQAEWAADNKTTMNIAFVLHEGDIVHKNTESEWINAKASMETMDGKVPYAIAVGNHDIASGGDTSLFNSHFPVANYADLPTFGGVYESGKLDNSYHLFSAGGTDWLIISLIYDPDDDVLQWAGQIATQYPDRRIILLTHAYLNPYDERWSIGENIWDKFARLYKNVTFVFNGHYTDGTAGRLVSEGDNGNKVYQMFANYQDLTFGGTGYLRIIEVDTYNKKVSVKTYSTYNHSHLDDDGNQFVFENVELGPLQ